MKRIIFVIVLLNVFLLNAQPFGNVAVFNGTNDIIEAPDAFGTDFTDEVTIEAWINPCEVNGYRIIGSKFLCAGDNNAFFFSIFNGKLRWSWDDDACANGSNTYQSNNAIIQVNQWQHVAVSHDSLGVTLFLNGVPVLASLTGASAYGPIQVSNQPFRIGAYQAGPSTFVGYFKGLVDEVRLWDTKRSSADILANYNTSLTGTQTDLVGYYKMNITNSGAGTSVPNSATATGTVVNATAIGTAATPIFETQNYAAISSVLGNDTTVCSGTSSLTLDATLSNTGVTYLWDNGLTTATRSVTLAGTYSLIMTLGCSEYYDTIQVSFASLPNVNLGNDTIICTGQSLLLDATVAGATYIWQDGSTNTTLVVNQTGTYSVDVMLNGCSSNDQINVTIVAPANVNLGPDKSIC
ncbi:MAG: LamG domain-containing protein [Crocinitomicaceae bacterium]